MRSHLFVAASSVALSVALIGTGCSSGGGRAGDDTGTTDEAVTRVCGVPSNGPVQGYDVSVFQGAFGWQGRGVAFGYARISDGTGTIDGQFDGNWARMKAAGVLRGAYQFFEPGGDEVAQANLMVAKVGRLQSGDLPPMIDVEVTGGQSGATIAAKVRHWLQIVEAGTGRRPIIYTGSFFWQDNVGDTSFGSYPVWIAAYGPTCPSLPNGWTNWTFWQYSDGNGTLDHDVFNGSTAELEAMAHSNAPPPGPPTPVPPAPSGCGTIAPGQGLVAGSTFSSCDGRFTLAMQGDGNLVLYLNGSGAIWQSGTSGTDGFAAIMQGDGNFVLYGKTSDALWNSGTAGRGGASLAVQDDGNLVVYAPGAGAVFATGTNVMGAPAKPTGCGNIAAGQGITAGEQVVSCDGRFTLAMQSDGNLVLYQGGHGALWSSHTAGTIGYAAIMQGDGNFVLYDRHATPLWFTNTAGRGGNDLAIQDDGNVVIYAPGGHPTWATDTPGH